MVFFLHLKLMIICIMGNFLSIMNSVKSLGTILTCKHPFTWVGVRVIHPSAFNQDSELAFLVYCHLPLIISWNFYFVHGKHKGCHLFSWERMERSKFLSHTVWVSHDLLVKILGLLIKVIIYQMVVIWMKQAYQSLKNGLMALYLGRIIRVEFMIYNVYY